MAPRLPKEQGNIIPSSAILKAIGQSLTLELPAVRLCYLFLHTNRLESISRGAAIDPLDPWGAALDPQGMSGILAFYDPQKF